MVEKPSETVKKANASRANFFLVTPDSESESNEPDPQIQSYDKIEAEITAYRNMKHPTVTEYCCPLQFYKCNKDNLPRLANLSKLVFCTMATAVPCECTFSSSGELLSDKRSRLTPAHTEDLMLFKTKPQLLIKTTKKNLNLYLKTLIK